jgi:hypothetical protein
VGTVVERQTAVILVVEQVAATQHSQALAAAALMAAPLVVEQSKIMLRAMQSDFGLVMGCYELLL